jgi:hypothetical protein
MIAGHCRCLVARSVQSICPPPQIYVPMHPAELFYDHFRPSQIWLGLHLAGGNTQIIRKLIQPANIMADTITLYVPDVTATFHHHAPTHTPPTFSSSRPQTSTSTSMSTVSPSTTAKNVSKVKPSDYQAEAPRMDKSNWTPHTGQAVIRPLPPSPLLPLPALFSKACPPWASHHASCRRRTHAMLTTPLPVLAARSKPTANSKQRRRDLETPMTPAFSATAMSQTMIVRVATARTCM